MRIDDSLMSPSQLRECHLICCGELRHGLLLKRKLDELFFGIKKSEKANEIYKYIYIYEDITFLFTNTQFILVPSDM